VKKVRLPLQLLPASAVVSALANFVLSLAVLAVVLAIFGPRHPEGAVYLPALILVQALMSLGIAYLLAGLNVFFRDVQHILGVLLLAWYFLTPVLFPVSIVADRPQEAFLLYLNPMTAVIVGYQRALLDGLSPEWPALAWSAAFAVGAFVLGFAYFDRAKDDFEGAL
jgi:ABC-type polysaccharide/polyol phosphate export permease